LICTKRPDSTVCIGLTTEQAPNNKQIGTEEGFEVF